MTSQEGDKKSSWSVVAAVLLAFLALSFFSFGLSSLHLGGDALGVDPSVKGYVLESRGDLRPTTPGIWLYSLVHASIALILTPAAFVVFALTQLRREKSLGRRVGFTIFLSLWSIGWFYMGISKLMTSLGGWLRLS